jgi:ABC-type sugar transport system ATPase subunit
MQEDIILRVQNINKTFPGVKALDDVTLSIHRGEVHGLLGENGAGKSTLMKILSGAYQPSSGTIEYNGQPLDLQKPSQAQELGIVTIYQEFTLVPALTIAENIYMGREPGLSGFINWRQLRKQTETVMERLGIHLNPMRLVRHLSVAEQQMVEIARALSMESQIIIMDEPTSALSRQEVEQLLNTIRELKAQGISIIFTTHHLEEAMAVCDRVTVLRDGRHVGTNPIEATSLDDIIRMMVGRSVSELFSRAVTQERGDVALRVSNLNRKGDPRDPNAIRLHDISFEVYRGEILGIAGLVGAGRTELARAIFGADPFDSGQIEVDGRPVTIKSPRDAIQLGLGLVPEDRKQQALFLELAVRENLSIAVLDEFLYPGGIVKAGQENQLVKEYQSVLDIRMSSPEQRARNLSGGNQQKVVISRWLALHPKVLIVDEPTRGIDIAAKAEVHQLLDKLAGEGIAIVMISSEMPEILSMSDRIITIREGRLTGEFSRAEATEEKLMQKMALKAESS